MNKPDIISIQDKLTLIINSWNRQQIMFRWRVGELVAKVLDNPADYPTVTLDMLANSLRTHSSCSVKLTTRTLSRSYAYYKAFTVEQITELQNTGVSHNTVMKLAKASSAMRILLVAGLSNGTVAEDELRYHTDSADEFDSGITESPKTARSKLREVLLEFAETVRRIHTEDLITGVSALVEACVQNIMEIRENAD